MQVVRMLVKLSKWSYSLEVWLVFPIPGGIWETSWRFVSGPQKHLGRYTSVGVRDGDGKNQDLVNKEATKTTKNFFAVDFF